MNIQTVFICPCSFHIPKQSLFLITSAIVSHSCAHYATVHLIIVATWFFLLALPHACLVTYSCMLITKLFFCRFSDAAWFPSNGTSASKANYKLSPCVNNMGNEDTTHSMAVLRAHIDLVLTDAKVHANFLLYFPFVDICKLTINVFLYMYIQ